MSKYTLTVNTDDINDIVQCLTPALVAAVRGGSVPTEPTTQEEIAHVIPDAVEVKPARRGRKAKAETPQEPEKIEQPVAEEKLAEEEPITGDMDDVLGADNTEVVITKQQVTDAAIEVGTKHGRDIMVAAIEKYTPTKKLAGVAESDYAKLHTILTNLVGLEDKTSAKTYLAKF